MTVDRDVLIVGAGPAGSSLATHLARRGFAVELCDRRAFPRPKPCGEFLGPQCAPYLRELGVDDRLLARGMRLVHGLALHGFGQEAAGTFLDGPSTAPAPRHGFGIRREVLDQHLLDGARAAGVHCAERTTFAGLLTDASGRVLGASLCGPDGRRDMRARLTVAADGLRSPIAQALGWRRPLAWLDRFALTSHFANVTAQAVGEVHLFDGGYFAATAVDDGLFGVNLVLDRAALRCRRGDWDAFVAERLALVPAFAARLAPGRRVAPWRGTGPLACSTRRQIAPGVALVGDAAGYVDPLTGEGIYFALWGARRLATAVGAALAAPRHERAELAAYALDRRREIGPRLFLARLLQRGLCHPVVCRQFLRACAALPALCDLLVTMTGGTLHPRDLLRPGAWRALRCRSATR